MMCGNDSSHEGADKVVDDYVLLLVTWRSMCPLEEQEGYDDNDDDQFERKFRRRISSNHSISRQPLMYLRVVKVVWLGARFGGAWRRSIWPIATCCGQIPTLGRPRCGNGSATARNTLISIHLVNNNTLLKVRTSRRLLRATRCAVLIAREPRFHVLLPRPLSASRLEAAFSIKAEEHGLHMVSSGVSRAYKVYPVPVSSSSHFSWQGDVSA